MRKITNRLALLVAIGMIVSPLLQSTVNTTPVNGHFEVAGVPGTDIGQPFGLCHAGYSQTIEEYAMLDAIGCTWMRIDMLWSSIEPADNVFTFDAWDSYIQAALLHGKKVLAILDYDVNWLPNTVPGDGHYISKDNVPYFLDYVNHTVIRYRDVVEAFEIWNEPNNMPRMWTGTRDEFFFLFNETARLIHSIDPDITIVGGVVAGHDPAFISAMFDAGIMSSVDAISIHPYSTNVNDVVSSIRETQDMMRSRGFNGDLWITEVGNPTGGYYGHSIPYAELPSRVIKTLALALVAGVKEIIWYTMRDAPDALKENDPINAELYFGLFYGNNTWKNGAHAFRVFSHNVQNTMYQPGNLIINSITSRQAINAFLYQKDGTNSTLVVWRSTSAARDITMTMKVPNATIIIEHDIASSETHAILDTTIILGEEPRIFTFTTRASDSVVELTVEEVFDTWVFLVSFPALLGISIAVIARQCTTRRDYTRWS